MEAPVGCVLPGDAAGVDLLEGLDVSGAGVNGLGDLAGALLEGQPAAGVDLMASTQVEQTHDIGRGLDDDDSLEVLVLGVLVDAGGLLHAQHVDLHLAAAGLLT